ncbi:MAG: primosomal protein N' [Nocardioides sp.]
MTSDGSEQLGLPGVARESVRRAQRRQATADAKLAAQRAAAPTHPVARVLVDVSLAHLDRPFDYLVPAALHDQAVPGARVKVRFAGQVVGGFILERVDESDHERLQPLRKVVSPEPVLSPQVAALASALTTRYAGTRADVLRLAIPPRHATAERTAGTAEPPRGVDAPSAESWGGHEGAIEFLTELAQARTPRAVWTVAPGTDWPAALAVAAATVHLSGRGVLVCLPDHRDVARLDGALTKAIGPEHHIVLTADAGPAKRYRDFLAISRGQRRIVIGTRAAAFAPVRDLGLVAIWDDGDDLFAEPRAPYPHTREVLLTRAELESTAALVASPSRSVEAHHLVSTGWAREIAASRDEIRRRARVTVAGGDDVARSRDPHASRIPSQVHAAIRTALPDGPVLVQTPRGGYAAALACDRCRTPARCARCEGPLRQHTAAHAPTCAWCGTVEESWACRECGGRGLRAPVIGEARTAEELGRSFPGVAVLSSSGDRVRDHVDDKPAIVVATPGAEPTAEGGYAAVIVLDAWWTLAREDMRATEEALRRWLTAAVLVRRAGQVVIVGDPAHPAVQALVRWDPAGLAHRESVERRAVRLPPASRVVTITGDIGAVDDALTLLAAPDPVEVLGPAPCGDAEWRAVIRSPRTQAAALSQAFVDLQRVRSARKLDPVRIQVDPISL